jgi:hypothetical protein
MGDFAKKIGAVVRAALLNNPDLIRQPDVLKNIIRTTTESVAMESKQSEQYKTLKDAAGIDKRYGAGSTSIWYAKNPSFRASSTDVDLTRLSKTHVLVGTIKSKNKDEVWGMMQGDFWSPEGQANTMINNLGLRHTSMSVGDIIAIDDQMDDTYLVSGAGFIKLSHRADESKAAGGLAFSKAVGAAMHNWHAGQGDIIYAVGSQIYAGHAVSQKDLDKSISALERLVRTSKGNKDDIDDLETLIGTLQNDGEPEDIEESKSALGTAVAALRSTVEGRSYDDEYSDDAFDRARDNRAAGFDLSTQQPFPPEKVLSPAEKSDRDRERKKLTATQQFNRPLMLKDLASMIPPKDQFAKVIRNTLHAVKTHGFVPDEMSYYFRKYGALPLKQADAAWDGKTQYVPGSLLK